MDLNRFTNVTGALRAIPSRRDALRGLVGVGLGLAAWRVPDHAEARRRKRKNRKRNRGKRAEPNAFGCVSVGKRCKNASDCCSSVCQGKKGKKTCRAHHTGTCDQSLDGVCKTPSPAASSCNGTMECGCGRSTAGTIACFAFADTKDYCAGCRTDADCEAAGYPAGSVCMDMTEGICTGACESGTACFAPCDSQPTTM